MAYDFYLGKVLLPIAPSKVTMKINNENKTITLINEGEVNMLKKAGLTDIEFDALLPNVRYPFAVYKDGFVDAGTYLEELEKLKTGQEPFQFIVSRMLPGGKGLFGTNMKVSLEDYKIKEDTKNGFDVVVTIKLKQYRDYGTKLCKITPASGGDKPKATVEKDRPAKKPGKGTYTVKSGDCLWNIAKKYYGDGSKYTKIYNANKSKIKNPNLIYPGQVLTIPS